MKKLIIIPAYNESSNIVNTIRTIESDASDFDYIIIDDCSTDNTLAICQKQGFNVISLPINLGIGGAVQTGYRYAQRCGYDVAVQVDGDGQHNPCYLEKMVEVLVQSSVNMVIGSRFITKEGFQSSFARRIGIKYFTWLIALLTGKKITDATSGLRLIDRSLIERFANHYPDDYPEPETVVDVLVSHFKVKEIPVVMNERQGGVSSISLTKSVYYMIKVTLAILVVRLKGNR
ncbi:glycosyltransferase family 2 protein [Streptococcus pyogenes]|uniref:Glycosyltransferase involved in cell wall biogenesis n=1 Tax=Streptococcus pyogenes serotype M12 (strain MGAS9429) TaxID=370551 RepID=Q1JMF9_STRPC|nr:glycosyltransferase family 2 protein [Streptococcus pyogenes]ABF35727.1 Glycosyltransferase involved in cell wall biogenesis [Streptococcus pyogenes MGAS2096]EZM59896.1 glycosyltransferase [Streptococcus pyogenes ABC020046230]HEP6152867.1 glycosyltransferase family 2 protein [Streptococcus pyogenes ABC020047615]HEP6175257.1 glycosyltransferase family 2 protein [Streptococcus pyogenes ABC020056755]HEP6180588.1 glycosyltransferase family 2 protein [Streptococcus pyogenes ABC020057019]HEP6183